VVLLADSLVSPLPGKEKEIKIKLRTWMKRTRRRTQIYNFAMEKGVQ